MCCCHCWLHSRIYSHLWHRPSHTQSRHRRKRGAAFVLRVRRDFRRRIERRPGLCVAVLGSSSCSPGATTAPFDTGNSVTSNALGLSGFTLFSIGGITITTASPINLPVRAGCRNSSKTKKSRRIGETSVANPKRVMVDGQGTIGPVLLGQDLSDCWKVGAYSRIARYSESVGYRNESSGAGPLTCELIWKTSSQSACATTWWSSSCQMGRLSKLIPSRMTDEEAIILTLEILAGDIPPEKQHWANHTQHWAASRLRLSSLKVHQYVDNLGAYSVPLWERPSHSHLFTTLGDAMRGPNAAHRRLLFVFCLARFLPPFCCAVRGDSLRQFLASGFTIPLPECFLRNLPLYQKLGELAPLSFALKRHYASWIMMEL